MTAYYNENDPRLTSWLYELMAAGVIAPGVVDTRSILDVRPGDLAPYTQCHFFAGIGVWSYALRLAGWPDDRRVWTGSCPCQPFSAAGKGAGFDDERHLWPAWFQLIAQCLPDRVYGEQVASKDGLAWLDLVHADLEAAGYSCGPVDLCAAGVGAPHIRQRLWFVADADGNGRQPRREGSEAMGHGQATGADRGPGGMADHLMQQRPDGEPGICLVDDAGGRLESSAAATGLCGDLRPSPTNGYWRDADWLYCRDGKWRPVEPGTFPLAHGAPGRVVRLRAYGNAIVAQAAAEVIRATLP